MEKTTVKRNGSPVTEKDVEKFGGSELAKIGFVSEKFRSPNNRGVPDQVVTGNTSMEWPIPLTFFVEYKRPYEKPTHLQKLDHRTRRSRGYYVFVVDSYESVQKMIYFVKHLIETKRMLPHPDELL
jgi:hypothetical protein